MELVLLRHAQPRWTWRRDDWVSSAVRGSGRWCGCFRSRRSVVCPKSSWSYYDTGERSEE